MRQRFSHKLLYFPEQFGPLHCVGCGRCVRACPVNIDIREIMQDVQRMGAPK
jgi:predicted aldo/keto reductase-like oxidoreductase